MSESCDCARSFHADLARTGEYARMKTILNHAYFPTFVGRDTVKNHARQGGLLVFQHEGRDVATTLVNARLSVLLVLAVEPAHQGHGLGGAIMRYLMPNFARVIEPKVPFFEHVGYTKLGDEAYHGRRFDTWLMVRSGLLELAGRVHDHLGDHCTCAEAVIAQLSTPIEAS